MRFDTLAAPTVMGDQRFIPKPFGHGPTISTSHADVERHWSGLASEHSIIERIAQAISIAGGSWHGIGAEGMEVLAPLDEFHCFGRSATDHMAYLCGLSSSMKVLDIGCGIGGPARRLGHVFGCCVQGIDITRSYVMAAELLNRHFGLTTTAPQLRWGDAIDLPYDSGIFDVVWVQVATASIRERESFFKEAARVLVPGGRIVLLDIQAGSVQPLRFPVAWAKDESTNAILTQEVTRQLIADAGFVLEAEQDVSVEAELWCREQADAYRSGNPPVIGFHLLHADWAQAVATQAVNLAEDRLRFAYLLARKSA